MIAGMLGYGLAAIAFLALALLALASWRGRIEGGLLLLAVILSAVWAGASAWDVSTPGGLRLSPALELLRDAAWLTFLARVTPAGQGNLGALPRLLAFAPAAVVLVLGLPATVGAGAVQASPNVLRAMVYGGLISAIAAFVFLEQIYRGLRTDHRRAVRPLVIGIGGIFAYDLFLYSHALLFQLLEPNLWAARGFVNLLAVPMLLLAARRNPSWSVDVFVSRHVTFYGTSLVGIGLYFLVMAVVGYWLKVLGREWGPVLQAVFFFGAGGLLAWTLFSPAARGRLKVFIAKHFYANKYDYREQWLGLTGALSAPDADPDLARRSLRAMADLLEAEAGVLWQRRGPKAGDGLERAAVLGQVADVPPVLHEADPVVDFMKRRQWTVNVGEAVREPQSHPGLDLPEWVEAMDSRSLLVPLVAGDTLWAVAALVRPRRVGKLNYEDIDLLRVAGTQVAAVLAQGEADRLLAENRQFEAFNRFAAFIMHDLKNIIAQQSLLVRNASRHKSDPEFVEDLVATVDNSVQRMQKLLEQLKRGQGADVTERVDVARALAEVAASHRDRQPAPEVQPVHAGLRLKVSRDRFLAVLGHLVTNAQDATGPDGYVRLGAAVKDGRLTVWVEDSGAGMDEEFIRTRLFKPFDSTKGTQGMGIGAYQARQFVEGLGGEVGVTSAAGDGTRFELKFPGTRVELAHGDASEPPETAGEEHGRAAAGG